MDLEKGEGRPSWLTVDDLPPEEEHRARPRVLYVAAALPWIVVAVLLARPAAPGQDAVPTAAPTAVETEPPSPGPSGPASPGPMEQPVAATITSSGALVAVEEDEARAVAVVAARGWLTTVGAGGAATEGGPGVYAEHLVVEGVDHPAPGAAVVTVRAVVLPVEAGGYGSPEVRRVAVPLRFDAAGASPAGEPYLLPSDARAAAPFELEPVEETELLLEAGEALVAAGYDVVEVQTLHRTGSWPLVVTADVRVDGGAAERVAVWLRVHLGRLVVAGTRPRPAGTAPATDLPSSPASDAGEHAGHDTETEHEEVAP